MDGKNSINNSTNSSESSRNSTTSTGNNNNNTNCSSNNNNNNSGNNYTAEADLSSLTKCQNEASCRMNEFDLLSLDRNATDSASSFVSIVNEQKSMQQQQQQSSLAPLAVDTQFVTSPVIPPPPLPQSSPPSMSTPPSMASVRDLRLELKEERDKSKLVITEHSADVYYIEQIDESQTPSPPPMPIVDDEPMTSKRDRADMARHQIYAASFDPPYPTNNDHKEINLNSICNNLNNSYNNRSNAIKNPTNQNVNNGGTSISNSSFIGSDYGIQQEQSIANSSSCLQKREGEERSSRNLSHERYLAKIAENQDERNKTLTRENNEKSSLLSNSNENSEPSMNCSSKMSNFDYLARINNLNAANSSNSNSQNETEMALANSAAINKNRFGIGSSIASTFGSGSASGMSAITTGSSAAMRCGVEDINLTDTSSNTSCDMNINNDLISDNDADVDYNLIEDIDSGVLFGHDLLNTNTFFNSNDKSVAAAAASANETAYGNQLYKSGAKGPPIDKRLSQNGSSGQNGSCYTMRTTSLNENAAANKFNNTPNVSAYSRPIESLKEELVISLNKTNALQQAQNTAPKSNVPVSNFYLTNEEFKNSSKFDDRNASDGIKLLKTFTNMKSNASSSIRREESQKCYSLCEDQTRVDHSVNANYLGAANNSSSYKPAPHHPTESASLMSLNESKEHSYSTNTKIIPIKIEFKDEQDKSTLKKRSNISAHQSSFDQQPFQKTSQQAADTKSIQSNGSVKKVSNLKKTNSNGSSSSKPRNIEKVKFSDVEFRHLISANENTDENTYSTISHNKQQQPMAHMDAKPILRNSSNRSTQGSAGQRPISSPPDSIMVSFQQDPILSSATIKEKNSSSSRTSKPTEDTMIPIVPQRLRHSNTVNIGEVQRYRSSSSGSSESQRVPKLEKNVKRQTSNNSSKSQHHHGNQFNSYYETSKKRPQLQPRSDYNISYYDRNHHLSSNSCSSSSLSSSISSLSSDSASNIIMKEYEKHGYRTAGCSSSLPPLHRMHFTLQPNYYQAAKLQQHLENQAQYQQQFQVERLMTEQEIYMNSLENQRHDKKSHSSKHHRRHHHKRHHSSSRHRQEQYYPYRHGKNKDYDTASMHLDTNISAKNMAYSTLPSSNSISSIQNLKSSKKKGEKKKHHHHHHRHHRHRSKNHSMCDSKESISNQGQRQKPISLSNNSLYSLNTTPVASSSHSTAKPKETSQAKAAKFYTDQHMVDGYNIYASVPPNVSQEQRSVDEYQRLGKYSNMAAPAYYSVVPQATNQFAYPSYQPHQIQPTQQVTNGNYYPTSAIDTKSMVASASVSAPYGSAQITSNNNSVNLVNNTYENETNKKLDEMAGESISQPNYQLISNLNRSYMNNTQPIYSNVSENYLDYYDETGRLMNRQSLPNTKSAATNGMPNSASSRFKTPVNSNFQRPPTSNGQVNRLVSQPVNMIGSSASLATAASTNNSVSNYMNMNGSIADENQKSSALMSMIYSSPNYTDLITENASFIDSPIHLLLNHHKQQRLLKQQQQQKYQQKQQEMSEIKELFSQANSLEDERQSLIKPTQSQQQLHQNNEPKTVNSIITIDSSKDTMKEQMSDEIYLLNEMTKQAPSVSSIIEKSESFVQPPPKSSQDPEPPASSSNERPKRRDIVTPNKAMKMKWTTKLRNFFAIMVAALFTISSMYLFEIISCIFRIENMNILFHKLSTFLVSFGIVVVMTCNYCFVDPEQKADSERAEQDETTAEEPESAHSQHKILQMPSADPASYHDEYDSDNQTGNRAYRAYSNALLTLQVTDSCSPHSTRTKQKDKASFKDQMTFILPKSYYFNIFYSSNTNEADEQPPHSQLYPDSLPIIGEKDNLLGGGSRNEMYDLNAHPIMAMPSAEIPTEKKPAPEVEKKPSPKQLKRLKQMKINKLIKNNRKLKPRFYLLVTSILLVHFWLLSSYLIYYFTAIQTTAYAGSPSLNSFLNVAYFIEILTAIIGGIGTALLAKCVVLNLFELYANNQFIQSHLIEISRRIRSGDEEKANTKEENQCEVLIEDDLESANTANDTNDAQSTSKYRKTHLSALNAYQKLIFKFFILLQSHWLVLAGLIYYVIRLIGMESIDSIFSKVCTQSIVSSSSSKLCPVSILKNDVFSWKNDILFRKSPVYSKQSEESGSHYSNPHAHNSAAHQKNHTFKGFLGLFDPNMGVGVSSSIKLFTIEDIYLLLISISLIKFILSLVISFIFIKTKRAQPKLTKAAEPLTKSQPEINPVKIGYLKVDQKNDDGHSDDDHGGFLSTPKKAIQQLEKFQKQMVNAKSNTVCGHTKLKPTLPLLHLMMPLVFFQGFVKTILLNELDKWYVSCLNGPKQFNRLLICYGASSFLSMICLAVLVVYCHLKRNVIFLLVVVQQTTLVILLFYWDPAKPQEFKTYYIDYIFFVCLAICDNLWLAHNLKALLTKAYELNKSPCVILIYAYSIYNFGSFAGYFCSTFYCITIKLYLTLILLIISTCTYIGSELLFYLKVKLT